MPDAVTKTRGRTRADSIAWRSVRVVSTRLARIASFRFRVQRGLPIETPARFTTASAPSTRAATSVPGDLIRSRRRARHHDDVVPVTRKRRDERPAHEARSPADDYLHGYAPPVKHLI